METVQNTLISNYRYFMLIPAAIAGILSFFLFTKAQNYANPTSPKAKMLRLMVGEKGYVFLIRFVTAPLCLAGSVFLILRFFGKV